MERSREFSVSIHEGQPTRPGGATGTAAYRQHSVLPVC